MDRPQHYRFYQGTKTLPFSDSEYEARLTRLCADMAAAGVQACVLTSMHNVAYYSGFLYCAFGRPYAVVVTPTENVTFSAEIDAAQPWRRGYGDNITYTDWERNNYWRAVLSVTGAGKVIGYEGDHLTLTQKTLIDAFLSPKSTVDIAATTMIQRMHKSAAEIELIRAGAQVADVGGYAVKDAIKVGTREIDVAMVGRDAIELEIAKRYPDAEYRDTWIWFQSGINMFFEERDLLQYRSFGYGHSFGVLSHYYGREAGLELREDIDTVLEPGMVISMEPMLTIPEGQAGAGGYREHDILVITEDGGDNITGYPYGPEFNVIG